MPNASQQVKKAVYVVTEREGGKSRWTRIGVAFENRDGSYTLLLDAAPLSNRLIVRDFPGDASGDEEGSAPRGRGTNGHAAAADGYDTASYDPHGRYGDDMHREMSPARGVRRPATRPATRTTRAQAR